MTHRDSPSRDHARGTARTPCRTPQAALAARAILAALALASGTALASEPDAGVVASFDAAPPGPAPSVPEHGKAFSCDATPVDPGGVELELAYAPWWWAAPGSVDRAGSAHALVLAAGVGLVRDLDARVALGWSFLRERATGQAEVRGAGVGDTMLALRWRFLRVESPSVDLAVVGNVVVPTGTRGTPTSLGTSQEAWSLGGALVASADRGPWTANAELGWSSRLGSPGGDDLGLLVANLALGVQVAPWLQPEVELNYQHEVEGGVEPDERVLWATAGVVLPVAPARFVAGVRLPVWQVNAAAGPTLTAALKLAF
jgi:hypothetical protein